MSIEEQISELIGKYEGLDARRLRQFNEENTKKDFILPLFRHLGWDVTNSDEVAAEEKSSNGRVDYAFKIGGVSKFYLEAKPLREDLNQRPDWAKQVITYAENKGVTWAVLTNFKQLMVFNAEWDKPALERARFLNLTYQEYLPAFRKLWWLSRDSVEKGVLDEEARQVGALKPKLPVEKSLLDQLLRWRGELFNQIYQHNKDRGLDYLQVDEPIQQFINRLIFIRSTEDRGIEENRLRATLHQWRDSGRKGELVERMRAIFHEFATLYDSDLFPVLDTWDSVFVESDTIERIIEGSYERPTRLAGYDFAAIDPKVLGAIYEQYLGYVAQEAKKRATEQARLLGFEAPAFELEARRIKRKQQGIYYTPEFVVDYIVKETVGRFIKEHSYNDIFNIKILDPACGSGSFLIRAYDELLHYHARQQGKSPAELDQLERRPILLRNIFGVDLDRQAVEITRLSLLLSCVAKREILPSLKDNIREGNSLISGTEEELRHYFGDDWQDKKRFNWGQEFEDIMANGGFDVVIGNPPYVEFKRLPSDIKAALEAKFQSARGKYDIYIPFLEQGIRLLKPGGYLGFICPTMFMKRDYGKSLRSFLINNSTLRSFVDFADNQVFGEATNYVGIFIFQKISNITSPCVCRVFEPNLSLPTEEIGKIMLSDESRDEVEVFLLNMTQLNESAWTIAPTDRFEFCNELHKRVSTPLSELCDAIWEGIASGKDQVFYLNLEKAHVSKMEESLLHPLLRGKDVSRWSPLNNIPFRVLYPYDIITGEPISEADFKVNFPHAYEYLVANREQLKGRKYFDTTTKLWYELWCERQPTQFLGVKILTPEISKHNNFTLDFGGCFFNTKVYGLIKRDSVAEDYKYLLGILNSALLEYYYQTFAPPKAGGFYAYKTTYLRDLPIRRIDFDNPKDKKTHDDLVALVDRMLELNKRLAPIRNTPSSERDELLREIKRTDTEIDQKVYELYGLTEQEKQIIEASLAKTVF